MSNTDQTPGDRLAQKFPDATLHEIRLENQNQQAQQQQQTPSTQSNS